MRLARVGLDGGEVAALEHEGALYRVDRLDEVLGAPLPADVLPLAGDFALRAFALAMAGLDDHQHEIEDGTSLDDCTVEGAARLLPPCGREPSLIELLPGWPWPLRLDGRALLGDAACAPGPLDPGPLLVCPSLAVVVGDDLHRPSVAEALGALRGVCLALGWIAAATEQQALQTGAGPGPGRELGTHLGPWLSVGVPEGVIELQVEPHGGAPLVATVELELERVAWALARVGRHGDVRAGDVVLVPASSRLEAAPGAWVSVSGSGLGRLWGQAG